LLTDHVIHFTIGDMTSRNSVLAPVSDVALGRELVRFVEQKLVRDPREVFNKTVLAIIARARPGDTVAAEIVIELFERGARLLGLPDFGISFAEWVATRDLGPVQQLWEHYATLADLLAAAKRYLPLDNSGIMFRVERSGSEARIVYALTPELRRGSEQFMEANLVLGTKVVRNLLGSAWRPLGIEMAHQPLSSARRMHACFRAPVRTGGPDYAIVFPESDLRARHHGGDEMLASLIERFLDDRTPAKPADLVVEVKRTISWLLRGQSASLEEAAAVLAIGPRTLQRKLRARGTDFGALLAEVRKEIALAYLARGPDQPIGQLTALLGYSEPSAVSRFLKQQFGADGRALRQRLS
jgi:AraC-like DNA-binding protein